jgi:Domain of unknown function (DUF309)
VSSGEPKHEDDLPVAARDALARLLMVCLGGEVGDRTLERALAIALSPGDVPIVPAASGEAELALERAGLIARRRGAGGPGYVRVRPSWDEPAVRRLNAYGDALTRVPRGKGLAVRLAQARVLLAKELFFEVHELLEPAWLEASGEARRLLQGLIQASVAWYHWRRGNRRGAQTLASAAIAKLDGAPGDWSGFPLAEVRDAVQSWSSWWTGGGVGTPPALPFAVAARRANPRP